MIKVEHELKTDERELIKAASKPATTIPFKPIGRSVPTRVGNAWSGASRVIIPFWVNAKAITDYNDFGKEEKVYISDFSVGNIKNGELHVDVPAHSVILIQLEQ